MSIVLRRRTPPSRAGRARSRRDPSAVARAQAAERYALRAATTDFAAWLVASDAWEEAGDLNRAALVKILRPTHLRALDVRGEMLRGIEDAYWLPAWANEMGQLGDPLPRNITRQTADRMPVSGKRLAREYLATLERINKAEAIQIYQRAALADNRRIDAEELGWYLTMESLGHGIGWTDRRIDSRVAFDLLLPDADAYADYDGESWSLEGEVSARRARPLR